MPLQAAGGTDSKNPFRIPCSALTLCAEADLTPQNSLPHYTLGQIISWLYPHIVHERPQILSLVEYAAALPRQRLAAISASGQQCFHLRYQRLHPTLKSFPAKRSIPHPFTQAQDLFGQGEQFASNPPHCPFDLTECLKIPFEMRPAQLTQTSKAIVAAPAVAMQNAGKDAQQFACCLLAASSLYQKHGSRGYNTASTASPSACFREASRSRRRGRLSAVEYARTVFDTVVPGLAIFVPHNARGHPNS
jgi:hypothetical protein